MELEKDSEHLKQKTKPKPQQQKTSQDIYIRKL